MSCILNEEALRYIRYLSFKMDSAREQEEEMWRLDYDKAKGHYEDLLGQQEEKLVALAKAMPKAPVYKEYKRPKNTHKKDGTLSSLGERWFSLLRENKLPPTEKGPIKLVDHYVDGNPKSPLQIKNWLYSLGWKPTTWKYVRDKATGDERKIEQVNDDGELCVSVKKLMHKDPAIEVLDGLTVINHRLGIFKGFLEHAIEVVPKGCTRGCQGPNVPCTKECALKPEYYLQATMGGLTNTLRFKHRNPLVNIPGVKALWGKEIRGCLIAPEGSFVVGSDMVSLEDTCKRHYIQPLDPAYVEEMCVEGFDPHMRLLVISGGISEEDYEFYTTYKEGGDKQRYEALHDRRKAAKTTTYSATYGVGKAKLARTADMTVKEAEQLLDAFWELNWAVKKVAEGQYTKTLKDGSMWLKNPVSGFYYSLRSERDRFSTLNQGTGVFCFDQWVYFARSLGVKVVFQAHDEVVVVTDDPDKVAQVLQKAIEMTNEKLQLNVPLGIDIQSGKAYSDVH